MKKFLHIISLAYLCLACFSAHAQLTGVYTALSAYGSTWKYLDNGSNQGTSWKDSTFSDAAWSSGTAPLGYGDPWIVTCVNAGCGTVTCSPSCTNKYITSYFRKKITLGSLAAYDSVRLSMMRDDGAVVYINGVEVWRENMPATGTITYTTGASANVGGANENATFVKTIVKTPFVVGDNYIAVEVHNDVATSSDQTFDFKLDGVKYVPTPVLLTRGPYLQKANQTSIAVRWRTNVTSRSRVIFGKVYGTYTDTASDSGIIAEHEMNLTGLQPDTKYYYAFGTDTSLLQGDSMNFFTTAPTDTSKRKVTIALLGDCGRNDLNYQPTTIASYLKYIGAKGMKAADVMLINGDNAYNSGTDAEFTTGFFNFYSTNVLKNHPLFSVPGNHDYNNGNITAQQLHNVPYYSIFSVPAQAECGGQPSNTEAYYSYNWGNVHFLALDSYGMEDYGTTRMYDTLGAQVKWIKKDLDSNKKPWVIAYWHHPPFTMGSHNSDNEAELINIRQNFVRILERYGVDLIICGHSHDYERSYLLKGYYGNEASFNKSAHTADSSSAMYNGTTNSCPYVYNTGKYNHGTVYVVAGSSGANDGIQSGYPHDALPYAFHDGGMMYIEVENNRLDAKFIRRDSVVADQFTIIKDTRLQQTITINKGRTIQLNASWPAGKYAWSTGDTTRNIAITPSTDVSLTVKDSTGSYCLMDQLTIKVKDTTTTPTGVAANLESQDGSYVYPVPAKDVLYLEMQSAVKGNYTFTMYDMQGRKLQSFTKYLAEGKQNVNIDVHNLPAGQTLLLKVNNDKTVKSFRFTRE